MQNDFIEQRRKLLEIFLIKICEIFFLFDCEEFQLFIRGPADFIKALGKKKVTYAEIAEKYQGAFQISNETIEEANIMDSENYLKLSLGKLESFENICKKNALNYEKYTQYLEGGLRSLGKVNESYQMYGKRFNDFPSRNDYSNPFHVMLQWTRIEILDFQAILEVISQRNEYVKIREKINEKVGNEQRNLSKIQTGKKSLGQKLANKSNSEQITEIETHIQEFIKELNMAKIIEEIITFRLVQIYLPGFRQKNSLAFSHSLWDFIQSNTKETNSLITQSAQISSIYLEN